MQAYGEDSFRFTANFIRITLPINPLFLSQLGAEYEQDHASDHASDKVRKLLVSLDGDLDRSQLQDLLGIKNRDYFRIEYLKPAIEDGFVELTIPDKPNSQHQKYRLTAKGLQLKELLEKNKYVAHVKKNSTFAGRMF